MVPLSVLNAGDIVCISCLGCALDQACRLREMGCTEGALVRIVSAHGNVVVQIGQTRLAIDETLARLILANYRQTG